MKWALGGVALLGVAGALLWLFGPREPVDLEIAFATEDIPEDLDAWLVAREAEVPALRPGAERRIVWAGAPGLRTPLALVYLHGFSASAEEIRPVPDRAAAALGANLYFARLRGHGRDGPAMAEATAGDWIEDLAEAIAIGRRIGERVVLIGTSTGGTLAALAAYDPRLSDGVAGIVFVSPNFRINSAGAGLLTAPFARRWLPVVLGAERGFEPENEGQAAHWTTRYPSVAVLPMAALVAHHARLDPAAATLPALFLYSEHDEVVSPAATGRVASAWGGPTDVHTFVMGAGDDAFNHVIAGDILSPGQTTRAVDLIVDWARDL
ncbi:MAG: alpha/beta fold hydrolase [Pseudomonadota bacterium]